MVAPASPEPEERVPHKRQKPHDEHGAGTLPPTNYPPQQLHAHHRYPPPSHFGRGPPPPPGPGGGYNGSGWGSQYGGPPPSQSSGPIYSQGRGPPPPPGDRPPPDYYRSSGPPPPPPQRSSKPPSSASPGPNKADGMIDDRPPQPYPGWSPHGPPQWHNPSYGPPPSSWQGSAGPPPPPHHGHHPSRPHSSSSIAHGPMHTGSGPPMGGWTTSRSPPRGGRMRQDNPPVARTELDMTYMTNRVNHNTMMNSGMMMDDDMEGSSTGESTRDKGRGSYKCGRCGVPKKGHVCPYQPKLKRRPDEPTPDTRNAAIQVEMDEFMTMRRLNLKIQGLPESYATEPYMGTNCLVVGEPAQDNHMPGSMHLEPIHHSNMLEVDHLQAIAQPLPSDDIHSMPHQLHAGHNMPTVVHMPLDDDYLIDPVMELSSTPDLPRSSPTPSSKDIAVGDDTPLDSDGLTLSVSEEKKE